MSILKITMSSQIFAINNILITDKMYTAYEVSIVKDSGELIEKSVELKI